jgi:hypothetical protein
MPFKSKKQKNTIDAAAHNPSFAKKVGIKTSDAKKMSAHGKGQTKFDEARTEVKDKDGKVTSWKDEGEWKKSTAKKDPRGKVTNMSDKARRETEKLSKAEKEMAESFEKAISEVKVTSGPNKGKQWSPKTPGPTNPNFKDDGSMGPSDGATAPPPGYKAPKSMKKAEVDAPADLLAATDGEEVTAGMKRKGKQVDEASKEEYTINGKKCTKAQYDAEMKKTGKKPSPKKVKEELKGKQTELDVAEPKGKLTGADFKALKGKKKVKESTETQLLRIAKQAMDTVKALREARAEEKRIKHLPISESDEYFSGLQSRLNKQIKG